MYQTSFTFANRIVTVDHNTMNAAIDYARHVVNMWRKTVEFVLIKERRDNTIMKVYLVNR